MLTDRIIKLDDRYTDFGNVKATRVKLENSVLLITWYDYTYDDPEKYEISFASHEFDDDQIEKIARFLTVTVATMINSSRRRTEREIKDRVNSLMRLLR